MNSTGWPVEIYKWMLSKGDPRVESWPLMSSPGPILTIFVMYLVTVKQGPRAMAAQKAMDLTPCIILYNLVLVAMSAYMFYEFLMSSLLAGYSYLCQPVDYSSDPLALRMANVCWWYFFSKIIELIDTAFLILRKKNVSFLHAYHHSTMLLNWWLGVKFVAGGQLWFNIGIHHSSTMLLNWWLGVKFVAGGQSWFLAMCNTFVHIIMYSYYGLSALGPSMQKYLWWKRYLTKLQLAQFVAVIIHTSANLFVARGCDFPRGFNYAVALYAISLVALFTNFYRKTYTQNKARKTK